jgi:glutathione peroxidase-family protein
MDVKYGGKLQIVAFPSNDFGKQEPYPPAGIREFVNKLKVKFHMMEKTSINGPAANPLFNALKIATGTEKKDISWNFETKFLVDKNGKTVERFSPAFDPDELIPFIDRLMQEPSTSQA